MACAGVLLTGGLSRRMGRDKATIHLPHSGGGKGRTLADRTARLLDSVCARAVEVGPGWSGLDYCRESPAGAGPLAAMAAGWHLLNRLGWDGPVLVVATDLPRLTAGMLRWLVERPGPGSVVPVAGGRVQPLCARYSPRDMDQAVRLVGDGERRVMAFVSATDAELVGPEGWEAAAGRPDALVDVDEPDDLRRLEEEDQ